MAVQTARCLSDRLVGGIPEGRLLEAGPCLGARDADRDPVLAPCAPDDQAVNVDRIGRGCRDRWHDAVGSRDRGRDTLAVGRRAHDRRRTVRRDIAPGVDARDRCLERDRVDGDEPRRGQLGPSISEEVEHRVLADRDDQRVETDLEVRARDVERHLPAGCVALAAVLGPGADEAGQLAILDVERGRACQLEQADPLRHAVVDLLRVGRHLVHRAAIDEGHRPGAEAAGRAGAVHRGVTGADHTDPRPDRGRRPSRTARRNVTPSTTPSASSPGRSRRLATCAPTATKIAANPSARSPSSETSTPAVWP